MVEDTAFRNVLNLLGDIGVYDVILPFLLVFTIVFAILEKTKILGVEKVGDEQITKKNINSIVALCVSLLVVASTQLVAVISSVMANVVLLLILAICFLLLVGVFMQSGEFSLKEYKGWASFFMVFMFIGIVAIFLHAFGWLEALLGIFVYFEEWGAGVLFIIILIGIMLYITGDPKQKKKKEEDK